MDDEYVALTWRTLAWQDDARYVEERGELLCQGWEVYAVAPWASERVPIEGTPRGLAGGACIMRKPKDEPQEKPEMVEYEYLGTPYSGLRPSAAGDLCHDEYNSLYREGWRKCGQAPWWQGIGGVFIWRRQKKAEKREPNWSSGYPFTGGMPGGRGGSIYIIH